MADPKESLMTRRRALLCTAFAVPFGLSLGCEKSEEGIVPKITRTRGDKDTGIIDPVVKGKGAKKK